MSKILIVEDDLSIQALLHDFIQEAGYSVILAADGVEALAKYSEQTFDLILLDIMLPKIDGYGVCEVIRQKSDVPIIMLTALDGEENQIKGLDLQADDYITKPFSMPVLLRKIAAVLRRSSKQNDIPQTISYRDLTLDLAAYKVYTGEEYIDLTPREFEILRELLIHKGRILTRQNLLQTLWKYEFYGEERMKQSEGWDIELIKRIRNSLFTKVFMITAVLMAVCCSITYYMTTPIKKISKISKQIAALDFGGLCTVRRTDEIGILADSLNDLSEKLSSALSDLQSANKQLQADIDKELELERQRIDFFSAASHELKTPITIIKGQLQGMLYQVGRYKARETYLAQSLGVTETLEKMVQELLTISRLDTPNYVCNKNECDLSNLINECLSAHEDLFMQRELTIEKFISPEVSVSGDMRLLQKVLNNLLGNAVSYSPAGNRIFVKLWQNNNKAKLTIENTGVHISDVDIPKLFEAFYRVDQSRNRQTGGTGLGLYIVKTILDLHGAEIRIGNTSQGVIVSVQF